MRWEKGRRSSTTFLRSGWTSEWRRCARGHARASEDHVRGFTGLVPVGSAGDTPILVVDRAGWIKANVAGFRELLTPMPAGDEGYTPACNPSVLLEVHSTPRDDEAVAA